MPLLLSLRKYFARTGRKLRTRPVARYHGWRREFIRPDARARAEIARHCASSALGTLEIVWLVSPHDAGRMKAPLRALVRQVYGNWTATIVAETPAAAAKVAQGVADHRVSIISREDLASQTEYQDSARYRLLICGSVMPDPYLTYHFADAQSRNPDIAYSDSDCRTAWGWHHSPWFKPDYGPLLAESGRLFGPVVLVRLGSSELGQIAARYWDSHAHCGVSAWQAWKHAKPAVEHICQPLYALPNAPKWAAWSVPAEQPSGGWPKVSVIIPTRDGLDLLRPCIESINRVTDYPVDLLEVIVIDNGSTDPATLDFLADQASSGAAQVLRIDEPFNFSRLNNLAERQASGEIIVFLNNDTIITEPDWIRLMASQAMIDDVGMVGGKLLYDDGTVQHAGVLMGPEGLAIHAFRAIATDAPGYGGLAVADREVSGVTAACLAMRKSVFREIGGFDEKLAVAFNDVSLCLAALEAGYRIVQLARPLLIHLESKSRGFDTTREKQAASRGEAFYTRRKHNPLFRDDKFYNPNLCLVSPYKLAVPPRSMRPWRASRRRGGGPLRVLIATREVGSAIGQTAREIAQFMQDAGHHVGFVTFSDGKREAAADSVVIRGPRQTATHAVRWDADIFISMEMPYHSTLRFLPPDVVGVIVNHSDYEIETPRFHADDTHHANESRMCMAMADIIVPANTTGHFSILQQAIVIAYDIYREKS